MKKMSCILVALATLTFWGGNAMADDDPVWCFVEINYNGKDFGGHDDGVSEDAAIHDAKEEACERACRKADDECEHMCMVNAAVKKSECKENPKANKKLPKGEYECRVAIRYNGVEYQGIDNEHHVDKAAREALEDACENVCRGQDKPKKCEHKCRVNADVLGTECFDLNDNQVKFEGKLPGRPAGFHPGFVDAKKSDAEKPGAVPGKDKKPDKADKKPDKADKKDDKKPDKADKKPDKPDKADKKPDKKGKK